MLRVCVSVSVIAMLTAAYAISPPLGWSALGTTFLYLVVRRSRQLALEQAKIEAR